MENFDSATFSVVDKNGFDLLYTVRQTDKETTRQFSERVLATSQQLILDGYHVKGFRGAPLPMTQPTVAPRPITVSQATMPVTMPETKECPIHKVEMSLRDGKFGPFYSHRTTDGFCNGKIKKERTY